MARKAAKEDVTERLRRICLALPEAEERETWGHATFRVRGKIFVIAGDGEGGRPRISFKAPPGSQQILIGADGTRFFHPPYVGPRGWVGMWLDRSVDWQEVALLVARSYRLTAPRKLALQVPETARAD